MNKISFTLSASQLSELLDCLPLPDELPVIQHKHHDILIKYNYIKAYEKLYNKHFIRKDKNKINFNPGEASAFWIVVNPYMSHFMKYPYPNAILSFILTTIDQKLT